MPLPLLVVVTGLLWTLATIVVIYAARSRRGGNIPETWHKQLATIVVSEVREQERGPRYVPRVEYTYTVGDVEYRSNVIDRAPRRGTAFHGLAAKRAAQFPRGKIVDVWVDLAHPDQSALVGVRQATRALWIVAAIMIVLAIVVPYIAH